MIHELEVLKNDIHAIVQLIRDGVLSKEDIIKVLEKLSEKI